MTDFPNGVSPPSPASFASPLLDFSPLANLEKSYHQGQQDRRTREVQTVFRNGIPKTADGQNDYSAMTDKMLQLGALPEATTISGIGIAQAKLKAALTDPVWGVSPPAAPAAASDAPTAAAPAPRQRAAFTPPQSDPPDARPTNDGGFAPRPPSAAPSNPSSAPNTRVADGFSDAGAAPQTTGGLAPSAERVLKSRLDALSVPERRNYLNRMAASPLVGESVNKWALQELARLDKLEEQTPGEKDLRRGVTQGAEDIKVEGANRTLTPEAKNVKPLPGESPAAAMERLKTQGAIDVKAGEAGVKNFDTEYVGLQKLAQSSYNGIQKAALAKSLTMQPGFYSGPLQPTTEIYQQFKSTFGRSPDTAVPQEAFQKVTTDMLTEQIKALGQSGVGRVLLAEVQNMQKGLASLGISAAGNRAQLEIVSRVYQETQDLGEIARGIAADTSIQPQNKGRALDEAAAKYYRDHPIFSDAEKTDPRILSAPDVPQAIRSNPQLVAWAKSVGLSSGNLIKIGGQIRQVP